MSGYLELPFAAPTGRLKATRHTSDPRANGEWAGWPIAKLGDMEKGEAKRLLRDWLKNEVLIEEDHLSPRRRKKIPCVNVNESQSSRDPRSIGSPRAF
jgi:hypothetical protein